MSDVRRCRSCGEDKAISVRDWEGTAVFGLVKTGRVPRRDFVCQACGVGFPIEPWRLKLFSSGAFAMGFGTMALMAALFAVGLAADSLVYGLVAAAVSLALSVGGVALAVSAVRPLWYRVSRPLVEGAEEPALRYSLTEPVRRCACGAAVQCVGVTDNRHKGVHTGMEWEYACAACGRSFVIESVWGQFFTVFASCVALAVGGLMASTAAGQGAGAWACSGSVVLIGVGGFALAAFRLVAFLRYPVLPQSQLVGQAPAKTR